MTRAEPATTASHELGPRATRARPAAAPPPGPPAAASAASTRPPTSPPRAATSGASSSSARARSWSCKGRRQLGEPFLDISGSVNTDGEGGLLSMAFAPDYKRSGRFYIYYTDRRGFIQIDQYRRSSDPDRADPGSRRSVMTRAPLPQQPQGRPAPVRPRRHALRRLRRRRRRRRPRRERPEPEPHPRQADQDRPAPGRRLLDPLLEPVRAPARRPPRDLRLRAAQPLPLLVRPPARLADHRRRRPGRGRGDRLRPRPRRAAASRAAATTSAGTCSRAAIATRTAARRARSSR